MSSRASKYDKMTPREHILKRPDTYIGDIEPTVELMDVFDGDKIITKDIKYVPGFFKIFDEILVNARDASENDNSCDTIKIEYNKDENYIMVYNNGDKGIPIEEHPEHKVLVPSMIFGELLTSSNYDDSQERTTGGRNGYGSKLVSVFSILFEVEIGDAHNGKKFKQTWSENMSIASKPKVTNYSKKSSYVQVKFHPDLKRFGLESMDDDHYNLFYRRALDLAGTSSGKLKVYWNGKQIDCNNFKKYISYYYPNETLYYDENERWKIGCLYIPDSNGKTVSFVNGISTYRGGTHCNYVVDNTLKILMNDYIKKKNKEIKLSPTLIKESLVFFINSVIVNPSFGSQTKHTLTTKANKFGSTYEPNQAFMKKLAKCGIVEQVIKLAQFKENAKLKKNDGKKQTRIRGIVKLEDANKAGTKDSNKCALILTEGDSAAGCARSGMSIIGRDYYGIFPLKGKLLNVREANTKQLLANEEINNIKQILGLKMDSTYEDDEEYNSLRYGRIIILTDQDVDGSHIKGLVMNLFHHFWPALLERKGFITSLATPIVKAFKGKETKTFYNLTEYEKWIESFPNGNPKGFRIKYYKGLGTSSKEESKEYFKGINDKLIKYIIDTQEEFKERTDKAIQLAFDKSFADNRKEWLMKYNRDNILTYEERDICYHDFIHKDLIHFSNDDTNRSIPHIMDGLKPSQRKILYGAFLRKLEKDEIKVAQLAGFVSDKAAYHHGEMSLNGAIVGMAQNFVGSNNINILYPSGNFGTRYLGGKDSASPRYIFTRLSDTTPIIFNRNDIPLLNNQEDDGMPIEPEFYAPIIPMVLVNGAEGIGTGFSTKIPNFNPKEIIDNLIRMIDEEKCKSMKPFYNKFKGDIVKIDKNNYEFHGKYTIKKSGKKEHLIITELPVFQWTQNYKEMLEKMLDTEMSKKTKRFTSYKDNNTDEDIYFDIEFNPGEIEKIKDIKKEFKLIKKVSLTNMHLYSTQGSIKKYDSVWAIMEEYYNYRLELYQKRKDYMLDILQKELDKMTWKCKFILMVINKELKVNNRKKASIEKDLINHGFPKYDDTYNYLLGMPIYNLTREKIEELKNQIQNKQTDYDNLNAKSNKDIWREELNILKESI
jgi:DNA topoisomerase-2